MIACPVTSQYPRHTVVSIDTERDIRTCEIIVNFRAPVAPFLYRPVLPSRFLYGDKMRMYTILSGVGADVDGVEVAFLYCMQAEAVAACGIGEVPQLVGARAAI